MLDVADTCTRTRTRTTRTTPTTAGYLRALVLNKFGTVLGGLGQNLVEFDLHTTGIEEDGSCDGQLGFLTEMRWLRHLKVIHRNLVGCINTYQDPDEMDPLRLTDVLPKSLETLHLH